MFPFFKKQENTIKIDEHAFRALISGGVVIDENDRVKTRVVVVGMDIEKMAAITRSVRVKKRILNQKQCSHENCETHFMGGSEYFVECKDCGKTL